MQCDCGSVRKAGNGQGETEERGVVLTVMYVIYPLVFVFSARCCPNCRSLLSCRRSSAALTPWGDVGGRRGDAWRKCGTTARYLVHKSL